jgi:hypothetical protein
MALVSTPDNTVRYSRCFSVFIPKRITLVQVWGWLSRNRSKRDTVGIWVESELGDGCAFYCSIPKVDQGSYSVDTDLAQIVIRWNN